MSPLKLSTPITCASTTTVSGPTARGPDRNCHSVASAPTTKTPSSKPRLKRCATVGARSYFMLKGSGPRLLVPPFGHSRFKRSLTATINFPLTRMAKVPSKNSVERHVMSRLKTSTPGDARCTYWKPRTNLARLVLPNGTHGRASGSTWATHRPTQALSHWY